MLSQGVEGLRSVSLSPREEPIQLGRLLSREKIYLGETPKMNQALKKIGMEMPIGEILKARRRVC